MKPEVLYVSERWLRTHVYEAGKESGDEALFGSWSRVHLGEARVTLSNCRLGHNNNVDPSTEQTDG